MAAIACLRNGTALEGKVEALIASGEVGVAVGREDERCPRPPVERPPEPADGVLVERTGGLIEKEEWRLADQGSSQGAPPNHAGGAPIDTVACHLAGLDVLDDP